MSSNIAKVNFDTVVYGDRKGERKSEKALACTSCMKRNIVTYLLHKYHLKVIDQKTNKIRRKLSDLGKGGIRWNQSHL